MVLNRALAFTPLRETRNQEISRIHDIIATQARASAAGQPVPVEGRAQAVSSVPSQDVPSGPEPAQAVPTDTTMG